MDVGGVLEEFFDLDFKEVRGFFLVKFKKCGR